MTATATEPKPRTLKAIAVSKLIGGKLVTTLAKREFDRLEKARQLCLDLTDIPGWHEEAKAADIAIGALLAKAKSA